MSLKAFHLLFIVASILLCWSVGGWSVNRGNPAGAIVCTAAGLGLVGYGAFFLRKLKKIQK
jgi:hypothetical protein